MSEWQVSEQEAGTRLDKWLAAVGRLGSRAQAFGAIERGKVFVEGVEQTAADAGRRLQAGERVRLWMDRPGSAKRRAFSDRRVAGLHLVYEDDSILVVAKPAGLLTVPADRPAGEPTLVAKLAEYLRPQAKRRPLVVHRIDRDTSGLVLFAKTPRAQERLKEQFLNREPERVYWAVVHGRPSPESGAWRDTLAWDQQYLVQKQAREQAPGAKEAISHYRVLEQYAAAALVEVRLVTGKRNQIRIQAGLRGHPLVGERVYVFEPAPRRPIEFVRQALHAYRLGFRHPADDRPLRFEAPLPDDFAALLDALRAKGGRARGE